MFRYFLSGLGVVRADLALLRRSRMLRLAVLAVSFVPAVYALIYLSSVWDPNAKTSALPAALVNLDQGIHYQGHDVNGSIKLVNSGAPRSTPIDWNDYHKGARVLDDYGEDMIL